MIGDKKIYKVKAGGFEFDFTGADIAAADLVNRSATEFNLIKDHRSVNAKLVGEDASGKKLKIELENGIFDIEIMDELDQVLHTMGFDETSGKQIKEIKAPMPGMVLEIAVTEGQEVKEGEKVLILGAMKMENSIVVQANATIKKIAVSIGQAVEKGQVLIELE